jgi:hypothetical protein
MKNKLLKRSHKSSDKAIGPRPCSSSCRLTCAVVTVLELNNYRINVNKSSNLNNFLFHTKGGKSSKIVIVLPNSTRRHGQTWP